MGVQGLGGISEPSRCPCYVPELDDAVYTRNDFMALCNGQEEIAEELFYEVDWQSPTTLISDWEIAGEIDTCKKCEKLFMSYNVKKCPHCGADVSEKYLYQGIGDYMLLFFFIL